MLEIPNTVLIIVDMQGKLASVMHEKDAMLANLQKLVKGLGIMEVPILATLQYPQGLGPLHPEIASLIPDVEPVAKNSFNCLANPEFSRRLESIGRRQVLLSGIEGHICVYQTVCDLISSGFEAHVVTDTVSSRTPENRHLGFEMMKQAGAKLTGTESALYELLRVAEGDRFKKISQILR